MKFPSKHSQSCKRFKHLKSGNKVIVRLHDTSVEITFRHYDSSKGLVTGKIADGSMVKFKCCDVNSVTSINKTPTQNWFIEGRS